MQKVSCAATKKQLRNQIKTSLQYRTWWITIYHRDNRACTKCKNAEASLEIDHIKPFAVILVENNIRSKEQALMCEELFDPSNGRVLCVQCHKKTKTWGNKTKKIIERVKK